MAEFAHVQRVRLLVLVLEMALQRVVTREGASTVRTLLRLVDATAGRWRHAKLVTAIDTVRAASTAAISTTGGR